MTPPDDTIERFLATGELDPRLAGWPGRPAERRRAAEAAVREVLTRIVRWRSRHAPLRVGRVPDDVPGIVRARAAPMIFGLCGGDAEAVLAGLGDCVRVLTPETFPTLIADRSPREAWDLANVLLDAIGAPPLADDTPEIEGIAGGGLCHVLPEALAAPAPLADVLVHELAHVLHDVRRGRFGLQPADAALVHVHPHHHETFAWACELWSALCRGTPAALLAEWEASPPPEDARVDLPRLRAILRRAAAGEGWAALRPLIVGSAGPATTSVP